MMSRRLLVVGCVFLALYWACGTVLAADLVVAAPAGPLARLAEGAFVAPFVQFSLAQSSPAQSSPAQSSPAQSSPTQSSPTQSSPTQSSHEAASVLPLTAGQTAPPVAADLTLIDGQTLLAGCKAGAFRKVDWSAIGGRDRLMAQAATDCGVGAALRGLVLAWSRDKFSGAPNWVDFWDVARVPGKRGLHRGARGNMEFALIADGVAPADVYSTLRSDAGVERAFRKLDQLKPYMVWWKTDEEAPRLLESGEALMTSAPADLVLAAAKATSGVAPRDFAVQWTGALLSFQSWAILANVANLGPSQHFLTFATDPKQQPALGAFAGFGSVVMGATDALGAAEKANSPATPANLSVGLLADETFWRDNGEKLDRAFETWLAKP